jgi:CarD family transcriptional regulator
MAPRPVLSAGRAPAGAPAAAAVKRPIGAPQQPPLPRSVIDSNAAAAKLDAKKKSSQRHGFRVGEHVVYPSHGVGKIVAIEEQVVAGHALELFVINFEQEKMTLRVPTAKLNAVGMRKLAEDGIVRRAMETLKGRARIKRTMWSRRAQEYENKINSGDLISISEVVRDLYRAETQPEQSYSERQLFEAALDRMSREIAAIEKLDERGASQKITDVLAKSAKGRAATRAAEEAAAAGAASEEQAA